MSTNAKRVVIVGGGAGGLELATRLGNRLGKKNRARIVLIDAELTHIWKPLLHEVAAGTLNSYEDELNYFAHASRNNFEFRLGRMTGLDRSRKILKLAALLDKEGRELAPAREEPYDLLVLAMGSTSNDFGTQGASEHCIFLDTRSQAERFHSRFLSSYLQAHAAGENQELHIAIVGAGATGVELSAELLHAAGELARYGLDDIQPEGVKISLIEAAPRILPALSERIADGAHKQLERIGIHVLTNEKVTRITEDSIETASGKRIPATLKVWAAGIKAPDFLNNLDGLETNRINQLLVTPGLQVTRDADIYAIGDCCSCLLPGNDRPIPPRAQSAHQMASYMATVIEARIKEREFGKPFRYSDYGSLVSLSKAGSVGSLMGNLMGTINIHGFLARMLYVSLYRLHQLALFGGFKAGVIWVKDQLARQSRPRMKLH